MTAPYARQARFWSKTSHYRTHESLAATYVGYLLCYSGLLWMFIALKNQLLPVPIPKNATSKRARAGLLETFIATAFSPLSYWKEIKVNFQVSRTPNNPAPALRACISGFFCLWHG